MSPLPGTRLPTLPVGNDPRNVPAAKRKISVLPAYTAVVQIIPNNEPLVVVRLGLPKFMEAKQIQGPEPLAPNRGGGNTTTTGQTGQTTNPGGSGSTTTPALTFEQVRQMGQISVAHANVSIQEFARLGNTEAISVVLQKLPNFANATSIRPSGPDSTIKENSSVSNQSSIFIIGGSKFYTAISGSRPVLILADHGNTRRYYPPPWRVGLINGTNVYWRYLSGSAFEAMV